MLLRQAGKTRLKRYWDLSVHTEVEHNEPKAARAHEPVRSARHSVGAWNANDHKRIEIHPTLSHVGRVKGTLHWSDPRRRLTLLLCLQHQPERQRERGRRP